MPYKFIEHNADIAVEVEANSIEDLFSIACHSWHEAALESVDSVSSDVKLISLNAESYEELLVQLLSELNFLLYSKKWVFNSVSKLEMVKGKDSVKLFAEIFCEPFNENYHQLKEEIKAITFHQMKIEKKGNNYSTLIVFDI